MKLRNKQTGEIGLVHCDATMFSNKIGVFIDNNHIDLRNPYKVYNSLAELNAEWEDAPEDQKEYYFISEFGKVYSLKNIPMDRERISWIKQIGNYFSSREEAEKAVEKLKAWQRLKDNGFEFDGWKQDERYWGDFIITATDQISCDDKDLDLLFGGEE